MSDTDVVETMKHHHATLVEGLQSHVDVLADQVANGQDHHTAIEVINAFLADEIYPHAVAEEGVVYPLASAHEELRGLVHAMIAEHRWLQTGIQNLSAAPDGIRAVAVAQTISTVFALHAEKENHHILPALAADPNVDLEAALARMHAALKAGQHQSGDHGLNPGPGGEILDVRTLPPRRRHELIFSTVEALVPGGQLELVNDHDPKPLRYQLSAEHPDAFSWDYLETGPSTWRVRIGRVAV